MRTQTTARSNSNSKPGSYTVEFDDPIGFGGKGYAWTEARHDHAGRETVLDLTAKNADIGDAPTLPSRTSGAASADSATVLSRWRDSVVEIWTPTAHAAGFVDRCRAGLIATNYRALGTATAVEVEITNGTNRYKVPGRVIVSERLNGAAIVWINPSLLGNHEARSIPGARAANGRRSTTRTPSRRSTRSMLVGQGTERRRGEPRDDSGDFRGLANRAATAPAARCLRKAGELVGISAIDEDAEVTPRERGVGRAARTGVPAIAIRREERCRHNAAGGDAPAARSGRQGDDASRRQWRRKHNRRRFRQSNFDITLLTSSLARRSRARTDRESDFGNWTEYVRRAPPVLLVRVSPQFEESMWKMLARGAASTQGMALPPLKSFTSNFLQAAAPTAATRKCCRSTPSSSSTRCPKRPARSAKACMCSIRHAFDASCGTVRLSMYSEKEPQRADIRSHRWEAVRAGRQFVYNRVLE